MILVTVGMQLGFDRLICAMDEITPRLPVEVVAQIGNGTLVPRNMRCYRQLEPGAFVELVERSCLIVGHAGIGTLLTAERYRKPLVLFPRRADLGEHRNDHQSATARAFADRPGISIARNSDELERAIAKGLEAPCSHPVKTSPKTNLVDAVARFIDTGELAF